jgi:hypothetical protein
MNHYMEIGFGGFVKAFASWTILFPPGSSASLTVGLPAAFPRPDPTGRVGPGRGTGISTGPFP